MAEFMECTACSRRSTGLTLCKSCLHNRRAIARLEGSIQGTERRIEEAARLAKDLEGQLFRLANL